MPRLFSIKPSLSMKGRKFKGIRGFAGKPFHPPLTDIPVAAYVLVAVFDVISFIAWKRNPDSNVARDFFVAGTYVIIAGAVVSVPTIITGFWDWLKSTPNRTQAWRTANWHMAVMLTMSTSTRTVTATMVHAWAFTVRRACVPFVVDFSQSQNPVRAANRPTRAPPMMVKVAAR